MTEITLEPEVEEEEEPAQSTPAPAEGEAAPEGEAPAGEGEAPVEGGYFVHVKCLKFYGLFLMLL